MRRPTATTPASQPAFSLARGSCCLFLLPPQSDGLSGFLLLFREKTSSEQNQNTQAQTTLLGMVWCGVVCAVIYLNVGGIILSSLMNQPCRSLLTAALSSPLASAKAARVRAGSKPISSSRRNFASSASPPVKSSQVKSG